MEKYFIPTYKFNIIDEEIYADEMPRVEKMLSNCMVSSYFESYDGKKIAYRYYLCKDAKKSLVISHGFTEFPDKYDELIWYFLNMGYNVFIVTHRGHGYSYRKPENLQITHVDNFIEYVKDFECFINETVLKKSGDTQLLLYTHSMGGTVGVMYMQEHPNVFSKAFLSSPMVRPVTQGASASSARLASLFMSIVKGKTAPFFAGKEFNPKAKFENGGSTSKCRFEKNLQKRIDDDHYKNSLPSNRWIYGSLCVDRKMLNAKKDANIKTQTVIGIAQDERVVVKDLQYVLAKRINGAKLIEFDGAKHEIYSSKNDILKGYYKTLFDFYGD